MFFLFHKQIIYLEVFFSFALCHFELNSIVSYYSSEKKMLQLKLCTYHCNRKKIQPINLYFYKSKSSFCYLIFFIMDIINQLFKPPWCNLILQKTAVSNLKFLYSKRYIFEHFLTFIYKILKYSVFSPFN